MSNSFNINMDKNMSENQPRQRPFVMQDVNNEMIEVKPNDVVVDGNMDLFPTHGGNKYLVHLLICKKNENPESWKRHSNFMEMVRMVKSQIQAQTPPGRFLERNEKRNRLKVLKTDQAIKVIKWCARRVMGSVNYMQHWHQHPMPASKQKQEPLPIPAMPLRLPPIVGNRGDIGPQNYMKQVNWKGPKLQNKEALEARCLFELDERLAAQRQMPNLLFR